MLRDNDFVQQKIEEIVIISIINKNQALAFIRLYNLDVINVEITPEYTYESKKIWNEKTINQVPKHIQTKPRNNTIFIYKNYPPFCKPQMIE